MQTRKIVRHALPLLFVLPWTAASMAQATAMPEITITPAAADRPVSSELFGAVMNWTNNGEGAADPKTGKAYQSFVDMVRKLGITSIRYGGGTISATAFEWKRAIGPLAKRPMNRARDGKKGQPSTFGPDEFGNLLDRTGARGDMILNFSRNGVRSAQQYLAYMTLPAPAHPSSDPNDPTYWAALRARNGHPAPYDFDWFDVGNEEGLFKKMAKFSRWRGGRLVSLGPHTTDIGNVKDALYAFGGTTSFTKQAVVGYSDLSSAASLSTGDANQVFYASYPPVVSDSQSLYVGDTKWRAVDTLSAVNASARVYQIDDATGRIRFGDGVHGAIPAKGDQVELTYQSGPHAGYVGFYKALKAVNPRIRVASEDSNTGFLKAMGSHYRYDGFTNHPLFTGFPDGNLSLPEYERQVMLAPLIQQRELAALQRDVDDHAGHHVPLLLSAYGQSQNSLPADGPQNIHLSLIEGLLETSELMSYQNDGVVVAHRFLLNDTPFNPDTEDAPTLRRYNAAIISNGKDDHFVATPVGLAMELMSQLGGQTQVKTAIENNPSIQLDQGASAGSLPGLRVIAARDRHGDLDIVVLNQTRQKAITAQVAAQGYRHADQARVETLNGPSPEAMNTLDDPSTVRIVTHKAHLGRGHFRYTFPAHSVTLIHLRKS